jgi:rhodanese-related sulfurtransferase
MSDTSKDLAVFDVRGAPSITVREANARLQDAQHDALLLDVREVSEYVPRHPTGAINIPMSQLQRRVGEVPREREVLVICEHGNRSVNVTRFLRAQGVTRALNVDGGTEEWEQARLPMEYAQS